MPERAQRSPAAAPAPLLPLAHASSEPAAGRRWAPKLPAPGGNQNGQGFLLCPGDIALCEGQRKQCRSSRQHRCFTDELIPKMPLERARSGGSRGDSALVGHRLPDGSPAMPSDSYGIFSAVSSAPDRARRLRSCSRVTEAFGGSLLSIAFSAQQLSQRCSLFHRAQISTAQLPGQLGRLPPAPTDPSTTDDTGEILLERLLTARI